MTTLVVSARPLTTVTSGYDIRVMNLCAQMGGEQHLVVVPLIESGVAADRSIDAARQFSSVTMLAAPSGRKALRRLLRRSEADYLRLSHPDYFSELTEALRRRARDTAARRVIFFGTDFTGVARACAFPDTVVDVCDSYSLTLERQQALDAGGGRRLSQRLALARWRRAEADLLATARVVTTINEADSEAVRRTDRSRAAKVSTVPNGVDVSMPAAVQSGAASASRSVGFWGNLSFGPNREAMRFFFERVYLPFLASSGVEVRIVGHGAEPWLSDIAAKHPQVRLLGFVEDLSQALRGCPLMINPMVSGSGMKNKVLEAFVRRMAVVTTRLGVEAFPGVRADEHARIADEPAAFAAGIVQLLDAPALRETMTDQAWSLVRETYSWDAVGRLWRGALDGRAA